MCNRWIRVIDLSLSMKGGAGDATRGISNVGAWQIVGFLPLLEELLLENHRALTLEGVGKDLAGLAR